MTTSVIHYRQYAIITFHKKNITMKTGDDITMTGSAVASTYCNAKLNRSKGVAENKVQYVIPRHL
jgi:hypothetical protein